MGALGFGFAVSPGSSATRSAPDFAFDDALPPGATLTRESPATYHDAARALVTAPSNTARIDHDPVTGSVRGVLIEGAATNLLAWSDGSLGQMATAIEASDAPGALAGFANAIRFAAPGVQAYALQQHTTAAGQSYVFSIFVRRDDGLAPAAGTASTASYDFEVDFDGDVNLPVFLAPAAEGGGMYRVGCAAMVATPSNGLFGPVKQSTNSDRPFVVSGFQLETGASPSSYIATTGAEATRAADVLTLDWRARGVGDGDIMVRYRFDDGSEQDVATIVSGGTAVVPTTLARPWLRSATRA